jgi:hypothetical protein
MAAQLSCIVLAKEINLNPAKPKREKAWHLRLKAYTPLERAWIALYPIALMSLAQSSPQCEPKMLHDSVDVNIILRESPSSQLNAGQKGQLTFNK